MGLNRRQLVELLLYYRGNLAIDATSDQLLREVALEIGVLFHGGTRWVSVSAPFIM